MKLSSYTADDFVVQIGDPKGPVEGFIDPSTEKTCAIPLEIMLNGENAPLYGKTLEVNFDKNEFLEQKKIQHWRGKENAFEDRDWICFSSNTKKAEDVP